MNTVSLSLPPSERSYNFVSSNNNFLYFTFLVRIMKNFMEKYFGILDIFKMLSLIFLPCYMFQVARIQNSVTYKWE